MEEHEEINKRLEWYHKAFDGEGKEDAQLPIDRIMTEIQYRLDPATHKGKELCLCEREVTCKCADEKSCICDTDDFHSVISSKGEVNSNCIFTVELHFSEKVKLSSKKTLKLFALSANGDEDVIMEIVQKSGTVSEGYVKFASHNIQFPLTEKVAIGKQTLHFQFNYMNYNT